MSDNRRAYDEPTWPQKPAAVATGYIYRILNFPNLDSWVELQTKMKVRRSRIRSYPRAQCDGGIAERGGVSGRSSAWNPQRKGDCLRRS
jgi:hypothetical protein